MKSSPLRIFSLATAVVGLAALFPTGLQASTLALETFNQDTTGNSIDGAGGGTGWSSNWFASNAANGYLFTTRTAPALAYPGYTAATTPAASGGNFENLASGFGGNQTTYVQRTLDASAGGTFGSAGLATSGVIGANNSTLWGSFLYSNDTSGNTGNTTFSFQLNGSAFSTNLSQPSTSNLVVFKINYGANYLTSDTVTYWINPNLASFDGTTGGTTTVPGNYSFTAFRATTTYGASNGTAGSQTGFDDVRFGTTLQDVAPVPEPATWIAAALLVLVAVRKFFPGLRTSLGRVSRLAA